MARSKYNMVFWDENGQHVRFKSTATFDFEYRYKYVGDATRAEFDLLLEALFELYGDDHISLEDFQRVFGDIRNFSDIVKKIVDES